MYYKFSAAFTFVRPFLHSSQLQQLLYPFFVLASFFEFCRLLNFLFVTCSCMDMDLDSEFMFVCYYINNEYDYIG